MNGRDCRLELSGLVGLDDGLDAGGRIRREGDLDLVPEAFRPLVGSVESELRSEFGRRLHSVYLYGSVPRGTAVVGRSDLDVSVVLHDQPTELDRAAAARIADGLDDRLIADEIGIIVDGRAAVMSADQRYDEAFHISCLCTPLWGPDLADELPEQFPTRELAAGIGRSAPAAFGRLGRVLREGSAPRADRVRQRIGRRIARHGFTTVLHRWPGWSSDPQVMLPVIAAFYPDRAAELTTAVQLGWGHLHAASRSERDDHERALQLLSAADWWLAEHRRVTRGA